MAVQLNEDVLELIFQYLDFRSLCSAEMTCRHWKQKNMEGTQIGDWRKLTYLSLTAPLGGT